ncbi:MAG: DUF4258 domain-containing protein [Flavobacteriales bacterium]
MAFYTMGLALGSVFLFTLFGNRYTGCAYFPNARVLQRLGERKTRYGKEAELQMKKLNIDTARIQHILRYGRVDFSKSEPRKAPCKIYRIAQNSLYVMVQMCERDSIATVYKVVLVK